MRSTEQGSRDNRSRRRPRDFFERNTTVTHVYDAKTRGVVVDHDTDKYGNFQSSSVYVDWKDGKGPQFCAFDELKVPEEKPRYQKRRAKPKRRDDEDEDSRYSE